MEGGKEGEVGGGRKGPNNNGIRFESRQEQDLDLNSCSIDWQ